jgi:hypothetical protein
MVAAPSPWYPPRVRAHPGWSGRPVSQVVDAAGQVANEAEQHVHRSRLDVPARLPTRHRVRAEPQQARQIPLLKTEPLADRADLVGGQEPMFPPEDSDRVLVEPFRFAESENALPALRAWERVRTSSSFRLGIPLGQEGASGDSAQQRFAVACDFRRRHELQVVEFAIFLAEREELVVGAFLDDSAVHDYCYPIGAPNG